MSLESRVVSTSCEVPAEVVYEFAHRTENLPKWASGLASGLSEEGGRWFADSPMGRVGIAMAPRNDFGVLDHDVTLPDGVTVHNAFRVTPAGEGSVLSFVVLRLPGVAADAFERDVSTVADDLRALTTLLERVEAS